MKQCILTVSTWLLHSDSAPSVTLNLAEQYPPMEAQGPIPDLLRKVLTAYETVSAILPGLGSSGRISGTGTSTQWWCRFYGMNLGSFCGMNLGRFCGMDQKVQGWGTLNLLYSSWGRGRCVARGLHEDCPWGSSAKAQACPGQSDPQTLQPLPCACTACSLPQMLLHPGPTRWEKSH